MKNGFLIYHTLLANLMELLVATPVPNLNSMAHCIGFSGQINHSALHLRESDLGRCHL